MAHITPQVNNSILTLYVEKGLERSIPVGSAAWWQWLNEESTTTFHVKSLHGNFTARREQKSGSWYWYAYRKYQGKLRKAYLGKTEELVQERLDTIAAQLSAQITQNIRPESPVPAVPIEAELVAATSASTSSHKEHASTTIAQSDMPRRITGALYTNGLQQNPLLTTKFYLPPPRVHLVARQRLMERLTHGLYSKLTLISAPAGFGKTTLLSSWQAITQIPHAWLALDTGDNDPIRFWTYVVATLQSICPTVKDKVMPLLQTIPLPPIEAILTILINECARVPHDVVLLLDDYHLITTQAIHDGMIFLLEHLPSCMHLVLISRTDPPLPLTRLRAQGQLTEIRVQDLRFTFDEVTAFLNQVMGLRLSHEEIAALDAHTEGWVAGLQLAALSMQGRQETANAGGVEGGARHIIESFTGRHRYVLDYLTGEVLQRQPEHVRAFLLQTSILERLSAPLCNAINGRDDSQAMLERLEQANLFLIPLDEQRHWYRYHHLFAEFLRDRLQQIQPDLVPQLHIKAANWYEQNNLLPEAVEHALTAHDLSYAAQLVDKASQLMHMRGDVTTFLHWLSLLPQETIRARPELHLFQAGAYMAIGQLDTADCLLQEVEQTLNTLQQNPDEDPIFLQRLESELIGSRSVLAAFHGDVTRTIELSRKALQLLPEENAFMRSVVATSIGNAYMLSGDFVRASEAYAEAVKTGMTAQNIHCVVASIAGQSYIDATQGHLHRALETHKQAIQFGTEYEGHIFPIVSLSYVHLAELWYEWNDLEAAERYARDGIVLGKQWGYIGTLAVGYCTLARIQMLKGNIDEALAIMQQIVQMVDSYHMDIVVKMVAAQQAWIQLKAGHSKAAAQWAQTCGLSEHEILPNPLEGEYPILIQVFIAQGRYAEALRIVERLLPAAETADWGRLVLEYLILQAIILQAQGQLEQALTSLARALSLGAPEDYIRIFIDKGEPIISLLHHAITRSIIPAYTRKLLQAAGETIADEQLPQLTTGLLSERELHVLRSIAAGRSNQEIAQEFVIALSTTKTHLNNIYTKLGVHSRTQAILKARELHLLE